MSSVVANSPPPNSARSSLYTPVLAAKTNALQEADVSLEGVLNMMTAILGEIVTLNKVESLDVTP